MSASRMLGKSFTLAILFAVGALPGFIAFAQPVTACTVNWSYSRRYDSGSRPTVSMARNGYFIEVHNSTSRDRMSYVFGRQSVAAPITGPSRDYGDGLDPSVSLRGDGVLVDIHSHSKPFDLQQHLFYRVGKVDVHGDVVTGLIHWANQNGVDYDTGKRPSVSVNSSGTVVEVHESDSPFSRHDLFYRVGHLLLSNGGADILWNGSSGIKYSSGSQPHINIDDSGNILEIHSSGTDNGVHYLHYLRGVFNSQYGQIDFAPAASNSRFVDKLAQNSGMTLINSGLVPSGLVLEVHQGVGADDRHLYYMSGELDKTTDNYVAWSAVRDFRVGTTPQVGTNGRVVIEVNEESDGVYFGGGPIYCLSRSHVSDK